MKIIQIALLMELSVRTLKRKLVPVHRSIRFDNEGNAISLEELGGTPTEVFSRSRARPSSPVKVPFLIARRQGADVEFVTLIVPFKSEQTKITAITGEAVVILVQGSDWVDTVALGDEIRYHAQAELYRPNNDGAESGSYRDCGYRGHRCRV